MQAISTTEDRNNWKTCTCRTQQLSQQADPEVDSLSDTEAGGASSAASPPLVEALSPVQAATIPAASLSTDGHGDCHHHQPRKRLSRNHIQIKTGNARSFKSYQFATSAFYRNASRVRLPVFWSAADLLFGAVPLLYLSSSPDQRGKTHNMIYVRTDTPGWPGRAGGTMHGS